VPQSCTPQSPVYVIIMCIESLNHQNASFMPIIRHADGRMPA